MAFFYDHRFVCGAHDPYVNGKRFMGEVCLAPYDHPGHHMPGKMHSAACHAEKGIPHSPFCIEARTEGT